MSIRTDRFFRLCATLALMGSLAFVVSFFTSTAASACTPTGNASCDDTATLTATGSGVYSDTTPTGSLTPPTANGTAQTGTVSLAVTVADFRGIAGAGAANWSVGLSSDGISVPTLAGPATQPLTIGTATGICSTTATCSGAAVVDKTGGSLVLTGTSAPVVASDANGDFGSFDLTIPGSFSTTASTVGGTFTGDVTVTLSTPVTP